VRGEHHRLAVGTARGDVVAVEGDVEVAERNRCADQLLDALVNARRDDRSPPVFSTISCAIRTRVRRMSSRSSTTFSLVTLFLPGLAGPG